MKSRFDKTLAPVTAGRLRRLPSGVLEQELRHTQKRIDELERNQGRFRNNPSEQGVVHQMNALSKLQDEYRQRDLAKEEIARRKEAGTWAPEEVKRTHVAKTNPPIPPALRAIASPQIETEPMEGEELPIKVRDGLGYRSWRASDGPIHGDTPADTITDVSKTISGKPKKDSFA